MIQPIPNHLALAIVATVVSTLALCGCCWAFPFCGFGIAAIVFASQVDSKARLGDIQGALAASKNAKMWSLISYGTSLLIVVLSIFLFGIMAFTGALKN